MHRALTLAASAPSLILKFVFFAIIRAFTMTIATFCHLALATERISRSKWALQVDVMVLSSVRRLEQHHDDLPSPAWRVIKPISTASL